MNPKSLLASQMHVVLACLLAVLGLAACGSNLAEESLAGIVRTPAPQTALLSLPRTDTGADYPLTASAEHILVVYFGYTACPDVCPTTMSDLRIALNGLEDQASDIEVVMATVDPDRDTAEVMNAYVTSFVDDAVGLRTSDDEVLQDVAEVFGANYLVETTDAGEIEVGHTGFLYAVDPEGNLLVTWAFGTPAEEMQRDLSILLARMEA